jgi:FkbM family methyltransferase
LKSAILNFLSKHLGSVVGSRNLIRIGAFIMRAGRSDFPNTIDSNGETLIQETILGLSDREEIVVIDCGANMGQWSMQLVSAYRRLGKKICLRVYCFEPSAYTFDKLVPELESLQSKEIQLTAIQSALSNRIGTTTLNIVHDGAGTNSVVAVPGGFESEETVPVTTVQEFARQHTITSVDILKIDAEGLDFEIILGAESLLDKLQIGVVQFEYNWRWIYGRHFLQEVFQYFAERDYAIGKITPRGVQFYPRYDVQLESFVEGNYIACTNALKKNFPQVPGWF